MPSGRIQFEDFTLDGDRYELLRAGQSIKLEKLPMELLILLVESNGRLVTRQEIIERLWGQDVFLDTEHGINTAIFKLRAILGDNADKARFIQTVTGKGYRFVASASVISDGADGSRNQPAPAVGATSLAAATPVQIAEQVPPTRSATPVLWWKKTVAVVGGIAGLMALVGLIDSGISSEPTARILDSQQITYSTERKDAPLVTDGSRLYFQGQNGPAETSVTGGPIAPLRGSTAGMQMLDVSPDGSQLLALKQNQAQSERGEIWSVPVLGGAPKRVGNETVSDARWMPDGRSVIYTSFRSVFITGPDGANPKLIWQASDDKGDTYNPSCSPDGRRIRLSVEENNHPKIWEVNIDGSHAHRLLAEGNKDADEQYGRWTADGKHFIFQSNVDGRNNLYEVVEPGWLMFWKKATAAKLTSGEIEVVDAIPSRDGHQLFMMGRLAQGAMQVFDPQQKRFVPFLGGLAAAEFVISPDHQWMAYTDFPRHFLWRSRLDGSEKLQLTGSYAAWPRWSPDGKSIVYMDWRSIYRISSEGGTAEKLIAGGQVGTVAPEWTPDGKAITFNDFPRAGTTLKGVQVLDLATRRVSIFPGSEGFYVGSWSPDGQYLVALAQDPLRMMLYKVQTHSWSELKSFDVPWGYWVWTRDSKSLLMGQMMGQTEQARGIHRLTIADGKWERIAALDGLTIKDMLNEGFLNLTVDGQPAIMNDTSVVQIYSLHWK